MPHNTTPSIVILSSGDLFADGIASRLRQYDKEVRLSIVNPQDSDYLVQIEATDPVAVILNAKEADPKNQCLLCGLLNTFPNLDILRLTMEPDMVQVIRNRKIYLERVHDLIDLLRKGQSVE